MSEKMTWQELTHRPCWRNEQPYTNDYAITFSDGKKPIGKIVRIDSYPNGVIFHAEIDSPTKDAEFIRKLIEESNFNLYPSRFTNYFAPEIKDVIFNPPATIVHWTDNTKTVVKCGEHDIFDPEKGLAMAISKKIYANKGNYYNLFKDVLKNAKYMKKPDEIVPAYNDIPFKNGDIVVIYEPNKYQGKFNQKAGKIGDIKVYHGHVNIGVEFECIPKNNRCENGLYYFNSSKVRKYVVSCENCANAGVSIASYPCNDCCFGAPGNNHKHYVEDK